MSESRDQARLTPLARWAGATAGVARTIRRWLGACNKKLLTRLGIKLVDIDLVELNEASPASDGVLQLDDPDH
jgi:acetyl-CoA acetyltransferase